MKKIFVILTIAATLMMVVPVAAAHPVPSGDRINIYSDEPIVYHLENTPFHIRHGWFSVIMPGVKPDVAKFAKAGFGLEIDGTYVEENYVDIVREPGDEPGVFFLYEWTYFNFPDGMTGEHTFTGHWYIECKYWVEPGAVCKDPNEVIEAGVRSITVIFTEQ